MNMTEETAEELLDEWVRKINRWEGCKTEPYFYKDFNDYFTINDEDSEGYTGNCKPLQLFASFCAEKIKEAYSQGFIEGQRKTAKKIAEIYRQSWYKTKKGWAHHTFENSAFKLEFEKQFGIKLKLKTRKDGEKISFFGSEKK